MMKSFRKLVSAALAAVMFLSLCPSALAADAPNEKCVTFYGLSALEEGESMQYSLTQDGEEVQVGIKRVPAYTRAAGRTWQVWYKALGVSVEFYMTVSNNKVTSAYDYSISLVGASYEDADLMHTST